MNQPDDALIAAVPSYLPSLFTREALAEDARRILAESLRYWESYDTAAFFARPAPDVWAPVDQVRHLTKSIRAVNKGLAMPRLFLTISFGWSRGGSRSFAALRDQYKAALANGGRAGRFAPRPLSAAEATSPNRQRIMMEHRAAVEVFARTVASWPERALDRYRLPHPLLGKLTLREMAQFTLMHNVHHAAVAERRRRGVGSSVST